MQRIHNMLSYLRMPSVAGSMSSASSNGCRHPVPAKQRCNFIHQRIADPRLSTLDNSTYVPDTAQWNVGIWGHLLLQTLVWSSPIMQSRCCIRTGRVVGCRQSWLEMSQAVAQVTLVSLPFCIPKISCKPLKKKEDAAAAERSVLLSATLGCLFMHQLNGICFFFFLLLQQGTQCDWES